MLRSWANPNVTSWKLNSRNKVRDAKRSQQEFSEDFNARRNDELGKLQRRIVEAIKSIAKDQEFDLILTDGVILFQSTNGRNQPVATKAFSIA